MSQLKILIENYKLYSLDLWLLQEYIILKLNKILVYLVPEIHEIEEIKRKAN